MLHRLLAFFKFTSKKHGEGKKENKAHGVARETSNSFKPAGRMTPQEIDEVYESLIRDGKVMPDGFVPMPR